MIVPSQPYPPSSSGGKEKMSRILSFTILGGLLIAAIAAINIGGVNAGEETKFVQFSVLAQGHADYGADEALSIPAVSAAIIQDKIEDLGPTSSIPVIKYTGLPAEASDSGQANDNAQPGEEEQNDKKEAKATRKEERLRERERREEERLREKEEKEEEKIDKKENRKDKKDKKETKTVPGSSAASSSPKKEAKDKAKEKDN
jgi:hypothetical protein